MSLVSKLIHSGGFSKQFQSGAIERARTWKQDGKILVSDRDYKAIKWEASAGLYVLAGIVGHNSLEFLANGVALSKLQHQ